MRRVLDIESLYLDFDGFFASVEQQCDPALRGRPVGVVTFPGAVKPPYRGGVIAFSREAKAAGVSGVMSAREAKDACPDMAFVVQKPALYARAHDALLNEIGQVIPIDKRKSIDEIVCVIDKAGQRDPEGLSAAIKARIRDHVGAYITASIGMSANRFLAKVVCKLQKPDGLTVLHPRDLPGPVLDQSFSAIPGIGKGLSARLVRAGLPDMRSLWESSPKQLRAIWGNVHGEQFWYALHGYDVKAAPTQRSMFGHSRLLNRGEQDVPYVKGFSRILLTKAARRMRREGFRAGHLSVRMTVSDRPLGCSEALPQVADDQAILAALMRIWDRLPIRAWDRVSKISVFLSNLSPVETRQLDWLGADDTHRAKWEAITAMTDGINQRFGKTAISLGPWPLKAGEMSGGKIAFTRVPEPEDFW